jgi:hypothetical protein
MPRGPHLLRDKKKKVPDYTPDKYRGDTFVHADDDKNVISVDNTIAKAVHEFIRPIFRELRVVYNRQMDHKKTKRKLPRNAAALYKWALFGARHKNTKEATLRSLWQKYGFPVNGKADPSIKGSPVPWEEFKKEFMKVAKQTGKDILRMQDPDIADKYGGPGSCLKKYSRNEEGGLLAKQNPPVFVVNAIIADHKVNVFNFEEAYKVLTMNPVYVDIQQHRPRRTAPVQKPAEPKQERQWQVEWCDEDVFECTLSEESGDEYDDGASNSKKRKPLKDSKKARCSKKTKKEDTLVILDHESEDESTKVHDASSITKTVAKEDPKKKDSDKAPEVKDKCKKVSKVPDASSITKTVAKEDPKKKDSDKAPEVKDKCKKPSIMKTVAKEDPKKKVSDKAIDVEEQLLRNEIDSKVADDKANRLALKKQHESKKESKKEDESKKDPAPSVVVPLRKVFVKPISKKQKDQKSESESDEKSHSHEDKVVKLETLSGKGGYVGGSSKDVPVPGILKKKKARESQSESDEKSHSNKDKVEESDGEFEEEEVEESDGEKEEVEESEEEEVDPVKHGPKQIPSSAVAYQVEHDDLGSMYGSEDDNDDGFDDDGTDDADMF